jgi:hypothetical protein
LQKRLAGPWQTYGLENTQKSSVAKQNNICLLFYLLSTLWGTASEHTGVLTLLHVAYEEKKLLYRNLASISSMWVQMQRRQGAYGSTKESLGTDFLIVSNPSIQMPPFFTQNAETDFLKFKESGPFKLT